MFPLHVPQTGSETHYASYPMDDRGSFPQGENCRFVKLIAYLWLVL
jgi:hypothetical protein